MVKVGSLAATYGVIATLLIIILGIWGFASLADEVFEGETRRFDERVFLALRAPGNPVDPLGPAWIEHSARDFTSLGGVSVLTLLTAGVVGFLMLQRRRAAAALVLVAVLGGWGISMLLKHSFDRPRPPFVPHAIEGLDPSFPSGHSMLSAVTYLTLGAMLSKVQRRKRAKLYLLSCAILLTLIVGASRVYLGVHWPTDVAAGWMVGAAWACICWLGAQALERRTRVDMDAPPPADPDEPDDEKEQKPSEKREAPTDGGPSLPHRRDL